MIRRRLSTSSGSTYVASANSGSVMIVAGFEFTRTIRKPSARSTATRLRARVVELARLADDDRAAADDEDRLEVGATGHVSDSRPSLR